MSWKILMYKTPSGQSVVKKFIAELQPPTVAKLMHHLDMLKTFGPQVSMPIAKPLGNSLYELRVRGRQEVRVFYVFARGAEIYLLHAFQKKSQATPTKELALARQRQKEIADNI
jgi:phage-related protein